MRWIFFCPIVLFGMVSNDLNIGLRALQQIRTLIPERLSDEEFSIIVDRKAFAAAIQKHHPHPMQPEGILPVNAVGFSHFYYSRYLILGEPIRILDSYEEFENGPYWQYPTAIQRLYDMHHATPPNSK